jgi:hypothetical protein
VTKTSDLFESRTDGALTPVVLTVRGPERNNCVSVPPSPVPIPDPDAGKPEQLAVIFPPIIVR